jgi:hypothetical protein
VKTYLPKITKAYILACIATMALCVLYFLQIEPGKNSIFFKMIFIGIAIIALPYKAFLEKYIIENESLTIKGLFPTTIEIGKIKSVKRIIYTGRSRPTTSTDCLEIKYGFGSVVYVAPIDMQGFVNDLLEVNPAIEANIDPVGHNKYFRVRSGMIVFALFSCIVGYVLFALLIPMNFTTEENRTVENGSIAYTYTTTFYSNNRRYKKKHYVDIALYNNEKTIRLSEDYKKYWNKILDTSNYLKHIRFKEGSWAVNRDIVYDPSPIWIDDVEVIPFEKKPNDRLFEIIGMSLLLVFFLFMFYKKLTLYIKKTYYDDKKILSEEGSVWKLIKALLID